MIDDKDLLRKAAKAAGIKIDTSPDNGGGYGNDGFDVLGRVVTDWHNGETWDPLNDDGDAFRLALKLDLSLDDFGDLNHESVRRRIVKEAAGMHEA